MYDELYEPLSAGAEGEVAAVARLLEADTGDIIVQGWDWSYYDTQQRKTDYGVDNFEVAKYFPLQQVLDGMFELTSEMFGIMIERSDDFDTWHDDVQLYVIRE
jgi:Zn-dependent oligopeptidase